MTYEELTRCLDVEGLQETAPEVHGLICGRIAGGERLSGEALRLALTESLDSEEEVVDNAFPQLETLYSSSLGALQDSSFAFQPLLPPDSAGLEEQVEALSLWCQGFLAGLGDAGLNDDMSLSEDLVEALRDLAAIAQVGVEGETGEEEEESDLVELQEYVRVAAILVFTELNAPETIARPDNGKTLH